MASFEYRLPHGVPQENLLGLVDRLNADPAVHGILVPLPLPPQVDANPVISAIRSDKDIDGFHPVNAGSLATGRDGTVPCTPLGCLMLLKRRLHLRPRLRGVSTASGWRGQAEAQPAHERRLPLLTAERAGPVLIFGRARDRHSERRGADGDFGMKRVAC